MKSALVTAFVFFFAGCASTGQVSSLNAKQATAIAVWFANNKALSIYHCQPFRGIQPATFADGRWIWIEQRGYGTSDIDATVVLAPSGSPLKVDLQVLYMQQEFLMQLL